MLRVDQCCVRCLGLVIPLSGGGFTTCVLGSRDDLEILVLQLLVNFLPAWQIEAAASPGSPGDHQHFLAAEIRKMNDTAFSIWGSKIGRHP